MGRLWQKHWEASLEGSISPKGILKFGDQELVAPLGNPVEKRVLVEVNPNAQMSVGVDYGLFAAPCTVDIIRHRVSAICCNYEEELGEWGRA